MPDIDRRTALTATGLFALGLTLPSPTLARTKTGGGPKPDLISQGLNNAEAPGGLAAQQPTLQAEPSGPIGHGSDYIANPLLDLYPRMAREYR